MGRDSQQQYVREPSLYLHGCRRGAEEPHGIVTKVCSGTEHGLEAVDTPEQDLCGHGEE